MAKQYMSGEGAIQFAPEAIARANADLLRTALEHSNFIERYCLDRKSAAEYLEGRAEKIGIVLAPDEIDHRMRRYGLNPCAEIIGSDFFATLGKFI
ncbi:MAG: hypothetical protein HC771_24675 [Synechococcales cyanobacterium CRU_2_2]|nr:hypothetical protein [Synechococcales cyanobacterium CRU_2_2]